MDGKNLLFSRRHAFYVRNIDIWQRTLRAYSGGRKYIETALIRHIAENGLEFSERIKRGIYLNFPRKITGMITEFLFASEPDRDGAFEAVVKDFSRTGWSVNYVMMRAEVINLLFGLSWILVDMPGVAAAIDTETKQKERIYPYAQALTPMQVPDWAIGSDGRLLWAIVEEKFERKDNPLAVPAQVTRRRLWFRDKWELYEQADNEIQLVGAGEHRLGCVPLVMWQEATGYGLASNHWFEDVVGISDAILNALSEAEMNIIKQMFGVLIVSRAFAECGGAASPEPREGETAEQTQQRCETYRRELSRSSALWEEAEEKGLTRYIAPTGTETGAILNWIKFLRDAMSDILRLALRGESRAAQTAESKEWDNNNIIKFLSARSLALEDIETQVWDIMHKWDPEVSVPKVSYGRDFSISDIKTAAACLMDIASFDAGEEFTKAVYEKALVLLDRIDRLPQAQYDQIKKEIAHLKIGRPEAPAMRVDALFNNESNPQQKGQTA